MTFTGSQLRILVAEAEGWRWVKSEYTGKSHCPEDLRFRKDFTKSPLGACGNFILHPCDFEPEPVNAPEWGLPEYDTSRDAITEAILRRFVTDVERARFATELIRVLTGRNVAFLLATASAEDLCRAFLAAMKGEK